MAHSVPMNTTTEAKRTAYYIIEAWRNGSCVWFRTGCQKRSIARRVMVEQAFNHADLMRVTRDGVEVAQITSGGFWKWTDGSDPLRLVVEEA